MMQIIGHMKVGTRLLIGFTLLLFFSAALIGVGLNRMALIQNNFEMVVNSDFAKIALVNKMRDAVRFQMVSLRDVVMQEDLSFKKKELKLMKEARKDYQSAAEQLAPLIANTAISTLFDSLRTTEEKVKDANSVAIEFSLNDQHKEAGEAVREKARPEQLNLIAQLDELLKRLDAEAKVTADEAAHVYKSAASAMVTIGIVAIALGVIIALAITRSIIHPLNSAVSIAKRIAAIEGSPPFNAGFAALHRRDADLRRIIGHRQHLHIDLLDAIAVAAGLGAVFAQAFLDHAAAFQHQPAHSLVGRVAIAGFGLVNHRQPAHVAEIADHGPDLVGRRIDLNGFGDFLPRWAMGLRRQRGDGRRNCQAE